MTVFKNFFVKSFLNFFPILLFFLLVTIPMLLMKRDIWDGTSIQYAFLVKDFSGLKMWFLDSGWFLQYPFTVALFKLADFFHLSFKIANAFIVLILMCFLLREVFFLCKKTFKFSTFSTYFSVFFVATFPAWASLMSSVMTFHLSCIFAGLLSVRLIHSSGFKRILGFFILVYSFSLNSNFTFLPVLSYCYDFFKKDETKPSYFIKPSLNTVSIFILGLILFLTHKTFFPPVNYYEGYNQLILFSLYGFFKTIFHILKSSTYLMPIMVFSFLIFTMELIFLKTTDLSFNSSDHSKSHQMNFFYLFLLFLSAIFPYSAVGKSHVLWDILSDQDIFNRYFILSSIALALLTSCYLENLYNRYKSHFIKKMIQYFSLMFILINLLFLIPSVIFSLHQTIFVSQIGQFIKNNKQAISDSGVFQIVIKDMPKTVTKIYPVTSNLMMYLATGNINHFVFISSDEKVKFTYPYQGLDHQIYSKELFFIPNDSYHVYHYDEQHIKNTYLMQIQAEGFTGPIKNELKTIVKNIFGHQGNFKLISISKL